MKWIPLISPCINVWVVIAMLKFQYLNRRFEKWYRKNESFSALPYNEQRESDKVRLYKEGEILQKYYDRLLVSWILTRYARKIDSEIEKAVI